MKIYSREKREDSMSSSHHASLLYVENLTYYRDGLNENPYANRTVVETFPDTIHFIPIYMPNFQYISCEF